ncbi:MAG TPA: hypothetical protein DIW44_04095 [Anaerolineaceae bacterium]|nr:hypothetical protein [Anaerolineaceae bacterium]
MKKSLLLPLAFIAVFILIVSAACNLPFGGDKTATEESQVIVVTATPEKVDNVVTPEPMVEVTEASVTEEPSSYSEAQAFYLEEFDGDLSNFTYDVFNYGSGSSEDATIDADDGALKFNNNGDDLYTYIYYEPYTYTDVRIDIEAENLATSDNSITLFCRYDEELGWYEYNIDNDGEWTLYYYDNVVAQQYVQLYDGGSTAIRMGRDTNTYTMICQGKELSLYINGVFTHSFEHKDLKEGQVGFGVSSYDSYPVKVNVNWLEISEP